MRDMVIVDTGDAPLVSGCGNRSCGWP